MKTILILKRISALVLMLILSAAVFVMPVPAEDTSETGSSEELENEEQENEELYKAVKSIRNRNDISKYGMVPVEAPEIEEGVYPVESRSNSVYFKMQDAEITVSGGQITARFTIPSMSYLYVYMGTKAEAADAPESERIGFKEENGCTVFTVPVEALDKELDCAAYSKNRKKWYDRKIIFYADSLPKDALKVELPDYDLIEKSLLYYDANEGAAADPSIFETEDTDFYVEEEDPGAQILFDENGDPLPAPVDLPDGEYSIEVNMIGGSGRASVSSPTWLTIKDGGAYATLLWSSTYYDYMIIGGKKYYNQTTDGGNSTFEIPIPVMNDAFPVIADTTAMGDPVEIHYDLTFYEDTIGEKGEIPQVAAGNVLIIAVIILAAGGVLNFIIKRKRAN